MGVRFFLLPEDLCRRDDAGRLYDQYKQHGIIGPEFSVEVIRKTYALVEYQDGTVHMVAPELITFTDKGGQA